MNAAELARCVKAINMLRPDWPTWQIARAIHDGDHKDRPLRDVVVAFGWVAADPESRLPERLNEAGPWWRAALADRLPENQPTPTPPRFVPAPTDPRQPDINRAGLANVRKALHKERP